MIKKLLLIVVSTGATQLAGVAQTVKVGIKAGASLSNGVGADVSQSRLRLGWHAGSMAQIKFSENIGIQAEAHYSLKGDKSEKYAPSISHRLAYLDVPVLLQYTLDDIFLEAGPTISHLLAVKPNDPTLYRVGKLPFITYTYGFAVGFGYQDPSGLQMGWRYTADLTPLYRDVDFSGDVIRTRIRNSTLQFYMGALFKPEQVGRATAAAGTATWRGSKNLVRGTGRLLFTKVPALIFRGAGFLFYRGPGKLVEAVRSANQKNANASEQPTAPPALPAAPLK
ncbi:outer membrane beta-barrel protein [Hymenobacter puniceus]|uniref:outer membrane beta-barrel protein n=1 Tax=Hymenobacter sp. BT190 TaxID=2763505 RepID=UPI00165190BE|nr:outer membrane beta-barrel protein [Hymenobacter sp. BT190]MBC6697151.1 PorT family protein [Hymenobacter sp. BT190]